MFRRLNDGIQVQGNSIINYAKQKMMEDYHDNFNAAVTYMSGKVLKAFPPRVRDGGGRKWGRNYDNYRRISQAEGGGRSRGRGRGGCRGRGRGRDSGGRHGEAAGAAEAGIISMGLIFQTHGLISLVKIGDASDMTAKPLSLKSRTNKGQQKEPEEEADAAKVAITMRAHKMLTRLRQQLVTQAPSLTLMAGQVEEQRQKTETEAAGQALPLGEVGTSEW